MYLGVYRFAGDPDELRPAYDRLLASIPADMIALQICVVADEGLNVFDACPSREVFDDFSSSEGFAAAVEAAGLPVPTVEGLGDVHHVVPAVS